jgi:hypothetical protein
MPGMSIGRGPEPGHRLDELPVADAGASPLEGLPGDLQPVHGQAAHARSA